MEGRKDIIVSQENPWLWPDVFVHAFGDLNVQSKNGEVEMASCHLIKKLNNTLTY